MLHIDNFSKKNLMPTGHPPPLPKSLHNKDGLIYFMCFIKSSKSNDPVEFQKLGSCFGWVNDILEQFHGGGVLRTTLILKLNIYWKFLKG